ncbi:MAG: prolyl oligopeptidase family serine peptidase [Deltaproteobacteria bacterium]|nr:prolyl oligopeptidase family serine peptidase [Deltaproteobacteria bacterium]
MERIRNIFLLFAALASFSTCKAGGGGEQGPGLMGSSEFFPFPSMHLMREDPASATGYRVDIEAELLPIAEGGTPMKVDRFNRLDGFSVATPCLVFHEDWDIDPETLPGQSRIGESVEEDSTVQIIHLETGERHLLMAEIDANDQAIEQGRRSLVIRPMEALEWASRYAVVLTTGIHDASGDPIPSPANFRALVRGKAVPEDLAPYEEHYAGLFARLEEIGISMDDVVLSWDFWTGSREVTLAQIEHVVERTRADMPADPSFVPDITIHETRTLDSDVDTDVDPLIWRHVELVFSMETFVNEDGEFVLDAGGMPTSQGRDDFTLIVHLPPSIHDAPAGSVPVMVFGHGLLGLPQDYLTRGRDALGAHEAADRYGMIYAAAEWRGLSYRDELDAVIAATDFGTFHRVTEDLHMGIANFLAVGRMFRSGFVDEEFLQAVDGSGSLVDTDRIYYHGISLGGHQGGVAMALSEVFDFGVLQVGGAAWTTMLERSSNWHKYEIIMHPRMRDPVDRQMVFAVTQMFWDPVDPCTHFEALRDKSFIMQESIGDAQVPNIATEFWARSVGIPLLQPSPTHPANIDEVAAPLGPGSSALVIYDPMNTRDDCGEMPPEANVPPEDNCSHGAIRRSEAYHEQNVAFFAEGSEGTIIHPPSCGDDPCLPAP